jgi:hypothetical protein
MVAIELVARQDMTTQKKSGASQAQPSPAVEASST